MTQMCKEAGIPRGNLTDLKNGRTAILSTKNLGKISNYFQVSKDIKKRLIDLEHTQVWLIEQVRQTTGLYFDDSYLYKIQTGQLATPKIVSAIQCKIRLIFTV